MAVMGIAAIKKIGSLGSTAQDARARAFARFVQGVAFGNLALAYDSASIVSETDVYPYVVPFSSYTDVVNAAYTELDSAITIARDNSGSFPLPSAWINGNALDTTGFFRLIRSYKARFRAGVARTPAERGAADWNAIIADATAGITADFNVAMNPSAGLSSRPAPPTGARCRNSGWAWRTAQADTTRGSTRRPLSACPSWW